MVGRSLEHHVLQQVGHARLAVTFVARADENCQVDGDLGTRRVGEKQHVQPIGQPILGDSLDRGDLGRRGRVSDCDGRRHEQSDSKGRKAQDSQSA